MTTKKGKKGPAAGKKAQDRAPTDPPSLQEVKLDPLIFNLGLPPVDIRQSKTVTPDPLTLLLAIVDVLPLDMSASLRVTMGSLRKIPRRDLAQRRRAAATLQPLIAPLIATAWRTSREQILVDLSAGHWETLQRWLHAASLPGLGCALADAAIAPFLMRLWIAGHLHLDAAARETLRALLDLVSKPHFPRDPEYTAQERTQRRHQQTTKAKHRFRAKTRGKQNTS